MLDINEKNGEGLLLMDMEIFEVEIEWVEDVGSEVNKDLMDIVMGEGGLLKKEEEIKVIVYEKVDEENKEVEVRSTNKDEDIVML